MAYNYWKMIDQVVVAIKTSPDRSCYGRTFNAYVADANDEKAIESAKDWARESEYDYENRKYTGKTHEPDVHTFENGGFTVKILESAGGSSQGGRLSFLACEVEKDGVKFVIGVNDALLVDLIRNSTIIKGVIQEKVMFVRKGGQPGFIHEGMDAYEEAVKDTKYKEAMKSAKKTAKWEVGGIYSTITQTSICFGEVWDTMEEVTTEVNTGWYRPQVHTKLVKREKPIKVLAWADMYNWRHKDGVPATLNDFLKEEVKDGERAWFSVGKPPARAKTQQFEVTDADLKLIDKLLSLREDSLTHEYNSPKMKGRYVRELK